MMDAVTYPDRRVAEAVFQEFVPIRVDYEAESGMLRKYNVFWAPTVVFADSGGVERYRITGYLPPDVFIAYLLFGRAKLNWETHNYELAAELFDEVVKRFETSSLVPQSMYLRGVCRDKATEDETILARTAEEMERLYPDSDWTLRTIPWRQEGESAAEAGGDAG